MTDRANDLARYLVVETARRSTALQQHFIEALPEPECIAEPSPLPPPGSWPTLAPDEIALGFQAAINVIRNAGFPAEAAQLSVLREVHGHG
ncbi:hypothetical protein CRT23_11235 [Methylobacterium sp. V23]|nr:hypothetical protein CRT23_11235 [Methylobacterium sp. V23]